MKKIAVYGSLLSGLHNYPLLKDSQLLGKEIVEIPYKMLDLISFPGLVEDENLHKITIEVYEVNQDIFERVEHLEGYPNFYDRTEIKTSFGKASIYFLADGHYKYENLSVNSGDWKDHLSKRHEKPTKLIFS